MTPRTPDDLDWLAFQYLAGALDAGESAAFEALLDADQSAREALASAVGLCETLAAAGPPRRSYRLPSRRAAASVLAAAACLLVALTFGPHRAGRDVGPALPTASAAPQALPAAAVELAWSGLRASEEVSQADRSDELLAWLNEPFLEGEAADEAEDGPPGWLFEAVALRESPES